MDLSWAQPQPCVSAVQWQQHFLLPTSFLDKGPHWAPLASAGPSSPEGVADSPLPQEQELGAGELLELPYLRLQP